MITAEVFIIVTCTTPQEVLLAKAKLIAANIQVQDTEDPLVFHATMTQTVQRQEDI